MLNTKKALYILPDLAFAVEFLPGKKPSEFSIQNFKQINGDLMDGNKLLESNLKKLVGKLEAGSYNLVLPDILFTNTIVNVDEEKESEVQAYIKEKVLADLKIDKNSHQLQTFILTELKGQSKVQLSSMQRSVLNPLRKALADSEVEIEKIFPASWTFKSVVSLEPSITVVQLGSKLYMAKHYIGIDQPIMDELDNLDRIVEAIKTLKGAEPSIQTVYLLSNELVEEEIKEKLSEVLPIQQLAKKDDEEDKIPSYTAEALKAGMRSIAIKDWELPEFELGELTEKEAEAVSTEAKPEKTEEKALPEPSSIQAGAKTETKQETVEKQADEAKAEEIEDAAEEKDVPEKKQIEEIEDTKVGEAEVKVIEEETLSIDQTPEQKSAQKKEEVEAAEAEEVKEEEKKQEAEGIEALPTEEPAVEPKDEEEDGVDLAQFVDSSDDDEEQEKPKKEEKPATTKPKMKKRKRKKVVKNQDGIGKFLKVVLIGLASFAVTVAVGVGIGLGVLRFTQSDQEIKTPISGGQEQVSPSPEPSATPTPLPEIDREELAIKVVNATTQAGYAGSVSDTLEEAGYGEVVAGNARGDYEEGFYLLAADENEALLQTLAEDTGFELTYSDEVAVEDAADEYDAVLVLAATSQEEEAEEEVEEEAEATEEAEETEEPTE